MFDCVLFWVVDFGVCLCVVLLTCLDGCLVFDDYLVDSCSLCFALFCF